MAERKHTVSVHYAVHGQMKIKCFQLETIAAVIPCFLFFRLESCSPTDEKRYSRLDFCLLLCTFSQVTWGVCSGGMERGGNYKAEIKAVITRYLQTSESESYCNVMAYANKNCHV